MSFIPEITKVGTLYLFTVGSISVYFIIKYYRAKRLDHEERTKGYLQCYTIDDFDALAKRLLRPHSYYYYNYKAGSGETYQACRDYFNKQLRIKPKALTNVSKITLETTIFGYTYDNPIMIAPTAFHCLAHNDGEWGTAQGATNAKSCYIYNWALSNILMERVLETTGPKWLHIYLSSPKELLEQCILMAEQNQFKAIVVTCDHPHERVQDRMRPMFEKYIKEKRDRALAEFLTRPNLELSLRSPQRKLMNCDLSWDDFKWLRSLTKIPIVCKGILTIEDAKLAIEYGANAIVVSNHGGRQIDTAPPAIECLKEVVDFVDGRIDVLVDTGIRSGTDVLKCLALGAKAVLVGRPVLYGLACAGDKGVEAVLNLYKRELMYDMASCGLTSITQIDEKILYGKPVQT